MSDNYEQPVEPMSRAEDILRGNTSTVPMSRIEALLKQLIEGGGGGGSTVTISTDYQAGTKIATLTIDGTDYNIYIPTDQIGSIVSISTDYQAGTKIATLTIDNTPYSIYIPQDQVGAKTYKGINAPASSLGNEGDIYYKCEANVVDSYVLIDQSELPAEIKFEGGGALAISLPENATKIKLNCHTYNQASTEVILDISDIPITNSRPYSQGGGTNVFGNLYIGKDSTHIYIYIEGSNGIYTWIASGYFDIPEYSYTKVVDTFTKTNIGWIPVEDKTGGATYSTDWVLVDKWIDNSNIYRKVINLGNVVNFPTNNAVDLASYLGTDADNISQIINLRGVLVNNSGTNQNGCGNIGFAYNQNGSRWLAYATNFQSYFTHLVIDAILTTEPS